MVQVLINDVQLGTAKAAKQKEGSAKYEKFKPNLLRRGLFSLDWRQIGDVDLVVNEVKSRVRVYPTGMIKPESVIMEGIIVPAKKPKPGEVRIEWKTGKGREARQVIGILFRIPEHPPAYVGGPKPKKTEGETPSKSKKRKIR